MSAAVIALAWPTALPLLLPVPVSVPLSVLGSQVRSVSVSVALLAARGALVVRELVVLAAGKDLDLGQVMDNLRFRLLGLLAGAATLMLTIGGVRYTLAGEDPSAVEKAKRTLKAAAIGYCLAILAPVLLTALKPIVGA